MVTPTAIRLAAPRQISSLGFSGAGFLACYHLGVAKCFMDQGILHRKGVLSRDNDNKQSITLTGASAGAIISAAISAGVCPDQGMEAVLAVSRKTEQAGYLNTLSPNFSLVDEMEDHLGRLIREAVDDDEAYFLQRIHSNNMNTDGTGGSLLRIGLTDRRVFPPLGENIKAACYCDTFRSIDDVLAACILSSYVPAITGPAWGSLDGRYEFSAIQRASVRLREMIQLGHVKNASTREPLTLDLSPSSQSVTVGNNKDEESSSNDSASASDSGNGEPSSQQGREICWDGGLVDAFPYIDKDTVIVTPLAVNVIPHASINPSIEYDSYNTNSDNDENANDIKANYDYETCDNAKTATPYVRLNSRIQVHWTAANAHTFRCISFSSQDAVLQGKFAQGYDNAQQWLKRYNLISVHHHHHHHVQHNDHDVA
jgi:hypothetical protein